MRAFELRIPRRRRWILPAWSLAWGLSGCEPPTPPPGAVRQVAIVAPSPTLRPGRAMNVIAAALDARGTVLDVPITWSTLTPQLLDVEATGEVRALAPGVGILRATAGSVSSQISLTLQNPPAARVELADDTLRLSVPGGPFVVAARALDDADEELVGAALAWSVDAPRIALVDASGHVTPRAVGTATLRARIDGVEALRPVRVDATVTATSPLLDSVSVTMVVPGAAFTIFGSRFAPTIAGNTVLVDGLAATVTAVTPTSVTALLPTSTRVCLPTRRVQVQVGTAAGVGAAPVRLRVAPQQALQPGESLLLLSPSDASCLELPAGEGRYLLAVQHAGRALGAGPIALTVDGRSGSAAATALHWPEALRPTPDVRAAAQAAAHVRVLEASRDAAGAAPAAAGARAELQLPPVNGVVPLRVPDLAAANICTAFTGIGARLVWEGERIAVLEDTVTVVGGAPTQAGRMDDLLVALGQEADALMFPIAQRFGNPLAMDSRLDANGKIALVVTPQMNAMLDGDVLGAVVTCDFFPRAQFASSNVGEMLYLQAPTSDAAGFAPGSRARWAWEIRGTVVHELKHVASFAERIVRGRPLEESWLEEATARHAEELYLRARTGAPGDAGYATIACELAVLGGSAACAGTPRIMLPHFEGLWDFLVDPALLTPLGPRGASDGSFYGSAWSLLRWALDHAATDEATFTQQLTLSGQTGLVNLEARSGRGWDEMLGRWALALLSELDGGAAPQDPTLRYPSWNLADVFAGLCAASGPCAGGTARFSRPRPLQPLRVAAGSFQAVLPELQPGGFAPLELLPLAVGATRLVQVSGVGVPLPSTARLVLLRVE